MSRRDPLRRRDTWRGKHHPTAGSCFAGPYEALLALLVISLISVSPAPASEAEATALPSDDLLEWDPVPGAVGYHVYRGLVSELSLGDGACHLGSVQETSAPIPEDPPGGNAYLFLVAFFGPAGQDGLGAGSDGIPRVPSIPCKPARRFFPLIANGDPGDGVEDGHEPRRNPSAYGWAGGPGGAPRGHGEHSMNPRFGAGVYLATGEFYTQTRDHVLLSRQVGTVVARTYRSQITYDGPFGRNWDSNLNARLAPSGTSVVFSGGGGTNEIFLQDATGDYESPAGLYSVLHTVPGGGFKLRDPDGRLLSFHGFDGSGRQGALQSIEDRNGNLISLLYDHQGLLTTVVDTLGRSLLLDYNALGRITSITDIAGRTWQYSYDALGDLVAVRSPTVTGTPTGNDFPAGKTTMYSYSSGFADERLNHNLLTIIAPNEEASGIPRLQNVYNTTPASFEFDRLVSQNVGGTNTSGVPAGGTLAYSYASLNPAGDPSDLRLPRRLATLIDRNGNQREYLHNVAGHCLSATERTNRGIRPGEPDYTTTYAYNPDGEVLEIILPEGNRTQFVYDLPGLDRYREGNLVEVRTVADPVAGGGRGDGHGGELSDVATQMSYDPVFNQLIARVEPRGTDPTYAPQNGGPHSADRYRTTWTLDYQEGNPATNGINALAAQFGIDLTGLISGLGDRNGDGRTDQAAGNVVRVDLPTVTLDPASNQAAIQGDTSQEIVALQRWNDLGQIVGMVDAEENVHSFTYFPETDPDGDGVSTPPPPDGRTLNSQTGGYLSSLLLDRLSGSGRDNGTNPTPASVLERFRYDAPGNLTQHVDGRGILTRRVFNELDQVVELRRAAATADSTGPDGDPPTILGEPGLTPFSFKVRWEYDANNNVTEILIEDRGELRGAGSEISHRLTWDIADERVTLEKEIASGFTLTTQLRYDPNHNPIEVIAPEGNSHQWLYDERDLLFQATRGATGPRAGTPSTTTFTYDDNGNLFTVIDGRGNPTVIAWDGLDRPARWTDRVGSTLDRFYDPAGGVVRELARGPVGGPSPTDQTGTSNVDLADVEFLYDEMGRVFERRQGLFVPAGVVTMRPPVLVEGSLAPADGATNRRLEYDRLSRPTFHIEDSGATTRFDYDGLGRLRRQEDPDGRNIWFAFDPAGNLIETEAIESSSVPGPPDEVFLSTYFYDALDRLTTAVDNLGQTWRLDYDSLDAVVAASDPNGPPGGTLTRRSPRHAGTPVAVNAHGNVTRYQRDGAGRLRTVESVLTATGLGDGTLVPPPDTSNPHNPDGLLRSGYLWDDNSLLAARLDDNGNSTSYSYDNLNRRTQIIGDDGTIAQRTYDAEDNPTTVVDPNGSVITNNFDLANRLVQTTVLRAAGVEGTTENLYEYDGLGRLTRSTDNNDPVDPLDDAEVRTFYDALGRVVEEQQILDPGGAKPVDYRWEAEARLTDIVHPSGRQIHYAYDTADRLAAVTDTGRAETAAFDYFGMGRVHTRLYGNGIRATTLDDAGMADPGFDGVQRLAELRHLDTGNALRGGFRYTYDDAGNRIATVRPHDMAPTGESKGELYALDSGYRLIDFTEAYLDAALNPIAPPDDEQNWVLDGEGGWEEMTRLGTVYQFTPSNMNEYDEDQSGDTRVDDGLPDDVFDLAGTPTSDGLNHGHDKNGNLTDTGRHDHVFDYRNRLVEIREPVTGTPVGTYRYDAEDRRVLRDAPGAPTPQANRRYLYFAKVASVEPMARKHPGRSTFSSITAAPFVPRNGAISAATGNAPNVLEVRDPSDVVQREIVFGNGRPLWQVLADGSSQYLHEDGQGSIVMLTEGAPPAGGPPGSPGAVLERVTYDAYGKPTFENPANQAVRTRAGEFVAESGFGNTYLFFSLWYDPESGSRGTTPLDDTGGMFFGRGTWHESGSNLMDPGRSPYNPDEGRWIARVEPDFAATPPDDAWSVNITSSSASATAHPTGERRHGPILFAAGAGAYNPDIAPSNLGTVLTPMHATAGKPPEIVVVGSKVKDVVREAGLRSDGELVQAVSHSSAGYDEGKLTLNNGAALLMKVRPLHDRVLVQPASASSAPTDKRKQSLYFPETMLQPSAISSLRTLVSSNLMHVSDVEGYPDIAGNFRDTADGETGHAHGHLDYLKKVGDPGHPVPTYEPIVIRKRIDRSTCLYLCDTGQNLGWAYFPSHGRKDSEVTAVTTFLAGSGPTVWFDPMPSCIRGERP